MTGFASPSSGTSADEIAFAIKTSSAIFARRVCTLIDVDVAVWPGPTLFARARERTFPGSLANSVFPARVGYARVCLVFASAT